MRILFLHPEDALHDGPWAALQWDQIVDLGRSGWASYQDASFHYRCTVTPIHTLRTGFKEIFKVRELLALGLGALVDRLGLDWWELTTTFFHSQLEKLVLVHKFATTIAPQDQVYVSRPGFYVNALESFLGSPVQEFQTKQDPAKRGLGHYLRVAKKFPTCQLVEIFWDKTDPGYQMRGRFPSRTKPSANSLVLLPTAYVNVSRTGIAYAKTVPDMNFLLVATRQSGWVPNPPPNVATAWLRSYASVGDGMRRVECEDLIKRWKALRVTLLAYPEFKALGAIGGLDDFPARLARGLEIRDAWRNVLDRQPVEAVLCADDSNPYTHIPLLLGKQRALATIACHHGALDGRYMFKRTHADVVLVKGKMEEDYLVRICGVPRNRVQVGAPSQVGSSPIHHPLESKPFVVFFSEAYEVSGGRGRDFYRDVLPLLADLAIAEQRQVIIKIHPAESLAERSKFVAQVLSPLQLRAVRVMGGPLESGLLDKTWFGVTVLSTVTVECALKGIPCFLCKWLEWSFYGYVDQFARSGAGIGLDHPEDIRRIPAMLAAYRPCLNVGEDFADPIAPAGLKGLLGRRGGSQEAAVSKN